MLLVLLQIHITLMITSLIMTTLGVGAASMGKKVHKAGLRANLAATAVGLFSGAILLLDNPLSLRCATLAVYLLGFLIAYRYMTTRSSQLAANK